MSSTVFRQLAIGNDGGKPERLFRAAVSAFCSLTRPSRQEVVQLEELALSLYPQVSPEARRFVAAALSESAYAPAGLVRRLALDDVEIAAPLLLRSGALSDATLISLIARKGLPHARAIARRAGLDPAIAALVRALEASAEAQRAARATVSETARFQVVGEAVRPAGNNPQPASSGGGRRSEVVRERLRAMMADAGAGAPSASGEAVAGLPPARYENLLRTALSGVPAFLQTALADALDVSFADAGRLLLPQHRDLFARILAGLGLSVEQAFLLVAATDPSAFAAARNIRDFVESFQQAGADAGRDEIRRLRSARLAALTSRLSERRSDAALTA